MSSPVIGPVSLSAVVAELVGTAFLLATVVGSGIAAERLTDDVGLQLFVNAAATVGVLVALILAFATASGAHFNPAVTLADVALGGLSPAGGAIYVGAQTVGGVLGVAAANVMFELSAVHGSTTARTGSHLWFAEGVATLGLVLVIFAVVRSGRAGSVAYAVGGYIGAAYFFTSSTSFANPAVTVARSLSDTFAGIEPSSVPAFLVAQVVGAIVAVGVIRVVYPSRPPEVV